MKLAGWWCGSARRSVSARYGRYERSAGFERTDGRRLGRQPVGMLHLARPVGILRARLRVITLTVTLRHVSREGRSDETD